MKNKKLTLTCGIILVVCASLSIIGAIAVVAETLTILVWTPTQMEGFNTFVTWTILTAVYKLLINIAQAIVYMIFGIKLIKNSKPQSDCAQNKTKVITLIVLVSCSLLFDPNWAMKLIYVALITLLSCALAYETKNVSVEKEKIVSLYGTNKNGKDLGGVDVDEFGNPYPNSKVAIMEDGKVVFKQVGELEGLCSQNVSEDLENKDQAKIAVLNDLYNNETISKEEYEKYLNRLNGVVDKPNENNSSLENSLEQPKNETQTSVEVKAKKSTAQKKPTSKSIASNKSEDTKSVGKTPKKSTKESNVEKSDKPQKTQNTNLKKDKE